MLTGKQRLAVLLSAIWLVLVAIFANAASYRFDWAMFLALGAAPVGFIWGIWSVVRGFRKEPTREKPIEMAVASTSTVSGFGKDVPQTRPWVRYWARMIDYSICGVIVAVVIEIWYPNIADKLFSNTAVASVVIIFVWVFIEPAFLAAFGTTPGKALLCTSVQMKDGSPITYLKALVRSYSVWAQGVGLGVPIINIVTLIMSYRQLTKKGVTFWDERGAFVALHWRVGLVRSGVAIVLLVGIYGLAIWDKMQERETLRIQATAVEWTNPITQKSIMLPKGWREDKSYQREEDDVTLAAFIPTSEESHVSLLHEEFPDKVDFGRYVAALIKAKETGLGKTVSRKPKVSKHGSQNVAEFYAETTSLTIRYDVHFRVWSTDRRNLWHTMITVRQGDQSAFEEARRAATTVEATTLIN